MTVDREAITEADRAALREHAESSTVTSSRLVLVLLARLETVEAERDTARRAVERAARVMAAVATSPVCHPHNVIALREGEAQARIALDADPPRASAWETVARQLADAMLGMIPPYEENAVDRDSALAAFRALDTPAGS